MRNQRSLWVSFSGADNQVSLYDLEALCERYAADTMELGILYFPEREGTSRYPSAVWRNQLLEANLGCAVSAHLCGPQVFREILAHDAKRLEDLSQFSRIQVNINASDFTQDEIFQVYDTLASEKDRTLVLQYYPQLAPTVSRYFETRGRAALSCDVLFDASRGKGIAAREWPGPLFESSSVRYGYAGGLSPETMEETWPHIQAAAAGTQQFWIDMESGIRTQNVFDISKAGAVMTFMADKLAQHERADAPRGPRQ